MIHIVMADGWMAVYRDDRKVWEGHRLEPDTLLRVLDVDHNVTWAQQQLDEDGTFPVILDDVQPDA